MIGKMARTFAISFLLAGVLCSRAISAPPTNLKEALTRVSDPTPSRVPLLAVDADQAQPEPEASEELFRQLDSDASTASLDQIASYFGRQPISCRSVRVLAPISQYSLNPEPAPAAEWAAVGREQAVRLLLTSLTSEQWGLVSSPGGLSVSDLSRPEQRAWFRSLVPDPFRLQQFRMTGVNTPQVQMSLDQQTTITPDQVHLRLHRTMSWEYRGITGQNGTVSQSQNSGAPPENGKPFWMEAQESPEHRTIENSRDRMSSAVLVEEPNRLKHSDVSFEDPPFAGTDIDLAGLITIGDLTRRISERTGVELYADLRVSGLTLTLLGPSDAHADSGDLLKALCYAVAGAVRKVEDPKTGDFVYILTNDRPGLMTSRLRLADWAADVESLEQLSQFTFSEAARKGNYITGIRFAPEDPFTIGDDAMRAAEANLSSISYLSQYGSKVKLEISQLSAGAQAQVREELSKPDGAHAFEFVNNSYREVPIDNRSVFASFEIKAQLVVPNYGVFPGPNIAPFAAFLPAPGRSAPAPPVGPLHIPDQLASFASLEIAPATDADIETAAAWAQRHGFAALFISVALWDTESANHVLKAALSSADRHHLRIYPVISLLTAPVGEAKKSVPAVASFDHNALGETLRDYAGSRLDASSVTSAPYLLQHVSRQAGREWADITDASVRAAIADRLSAIAKTPGIAGIILVDVAAPGSASPNDGGLAISGISAMSGGNSPSLRLALIRSENVDPIDLPPHGRLLPDQTLSYGHIGKEPYFVDTFGFSQNDWNAVRFHRATDGTWATEQREGNGLQEGSPVDPIASWNALRRETTRKYVGEIRQAAKLPASLPVLVMAQNEYLNINYPPWYADWPSGDPLMPIEKPKSAILSYTLNSRSPDSIRNWLAVQLPQRLHSAAISGAPVSGLNGVVIDASAMPIDQGLTLIDMITAAK